METQVELYPLKERVKIAALAVFGSYVEWYDYFIAATAAALVWSDVFFSAYPYLSTVFSIAAFGVAYFTRPVGAYIFGHIGDKYGRKSSLIYTLLTVSVAMFGISVLPSANSIGVIAPILLFVFRAIQGIGFGGEYGGAATWVLETNAYSKWRASWTSLTMAVIGLGSGTGAALYYYLSTHFSRADLLNFWWRVPFFIGVVLIISAAIIRYFALESNLFVKLQKAGKVLKNPANVAIKTHIGLMLLIATTWLYIFWVNPATIQLFATPYLAKMGISRTYVTYTLIVSNFIIPFTTIFGGFLSDLIGRRTTIVISALSVAIFIYPYIILLQSGNLFNILIAQIILNALAFIGEGSFTAYFPELFRTQFRYTGSGVSYQFTAMYMGFVYSFLLPAILLSGNPTIYVIIVTIVFCGLSMLIRLRLWQETVKSDISHV